MYLKILRSQFWIKQKMREQVVTNAIHQNIHTSISWVVTNMAAITAPIRVVT